jgi:hypothetical protein
LLVFALVLPAVGARAKDTWRVARTEHFEVLSAASEKQTRRLLVDLEQFRASFLTNFALGAAHEPRVNVVLFNSERTFTPYKPVYRGKPKDVAGYFVGGVDEVTIALDLEGGGDEWGDPTEAIFHEYIHLLVHTRGLTLPLWLNEGLAELYSTFRVNGDTVEFGRPKDLYVAVLSQGALMPMQRLTAVDETAPEYNEEERAGIFYAQSWALAHFLVCGTDRTNAARLGRYLTALANPTADGKDGTLREVFGKDFDLLEDKLRAYLQGGSYYTRRAPAPLKLAPSAITMRLATDLERDCALLNLRWRVHRGDGDLGAARHVARENPGAPRPRELVAIMALAEGDVALATESWERAAELGTENAFALVQAVRIKLAEFGPAAEPAQRLAPAELAKVRHWIDGVLERSPLCDEAIEQLAWIEARAPEVRVPAVQRVQGRANQMKDRDPTLLALALIRWRLGDPATARAITDAILESRRALPSLKAAAREMREHFESAGAAKPAPAR